MSTKLQELTLEHIDTKELESQSFISISWPALTKFSLTAEKIRASSLLELLLSMPLLKEFVLDISLKLEEEQHRQYLLAQFDNCYVAHDRPIYKPFQLQMTKGTQLIITKGTIFSFTLLMKLLRCFPTLSELYFEDFNMGKAEGIPAVITNVRKLSIGYKHELQAINLDTLAIFLNHMSSLQVLTLCGLDIKETYIVYQDIPELLKKSLQLLQQFHMTWCIINPKTLVLMLSCIPALKEVSFHMVNALGPGEHDTCVPVDDSSFIKFVHHQYGSTVFNFKMQEAHAELGMFWGFVSQNTLHDVCRCRPLLEKVTLKDMHVIETPGIVQTAMSSVITECAMIHVVISRKALKALIDSMPHTKTLTLDRSRIQWEVPHLEVIVECTVGSNVKLETNLLSQFKNCETFLEQVSLIASVDHMVLMPLLRETSVRVVPFRNINNDMFAFANQVHEHLGHKLLNKSSMFNLFCFRECFLNKNKLSEYNCKDLVLSSCSLDPKSLQNIVNCMPSLAKVDMRECAILLACNTDVLMGYTVTHPSLQRPLWLPDRFKPHELKVRDVAEIHDTIKYMERDINKTVVCTSSQAVQGIPLLFYLSTSLMEDHNIRSDIKLYSCRLQVTKEELMQILTDFQPKEPVIHRRILLEDSTIIVNL